MVRNWAFLKTDGVKPRLNILATQYKKLHQAFLKINLTNKQRKSK